MALHNQKHIDEARAQIYEVKVKSEPIVEEKNGDHQTDIGGAINLSSQSSSSAADNKVSGKFKCTTFFLV